MPYVKGDRRQRLSWIVAWICLDHTYPRLGVIEKHGLSMFQAIMGSE